MSEPSVASAYTALGQAAAGRDVRIAGWGSGISKHGSTTAIAVTNVGDAAAQVTLELYNEEGMHMGHCGTACEATLEPDHTHYWWMPELRDLGLHLWPSQGTARVVGTQPLVAVALAVSVPDDSGSREDAVAFVGAAADATVRHDAALPLMLSGISKWAPRPGTPVPPVARYGTNAHGASSLAVVNLDDSSAMQASARFYPQLEGPPFERTVEVQPDEWFAFYVPHVVAAEGVYAGLLQTDAAMASVAFTRWLYSGSRVAHAGAASAVELRVPLVVKHTAGFCSDVTIQNTKLDSPTVAVVEIFTAAGGEIYLTREYQISAGASTTLFLCDADEFVAGLPHQFVGSMRIRAKDGLTNLAAQTLNRHVSYSDAVQALVGVPVEAASTVLSVPMVHAAWPLPPTDPLYRLDTKLAIANADDGSIEVEVTYRGVRGSCAGERRSHGPFEVAQNGVVVLQPGEDGVLPAGCLASARIDATGPVHAQVLDTDQYEVRPTPTQSGPSATPTRTPTATPTAVPPLPPLEGYEFELLNVNPTPGEGSHVNGMAPLGNRLLFSADDGSNVKALWSTSGGADGMRLVSPEAVVGGQHDDGDDMSFEDPEFTQMGDLLLYHAYTAGHGSELWATDGTTSGTRMVRDIQPGDAGSSPRQLVRFGDHVYFSADDGEHGKELWRTDGSSVGTVLVKDIAPPEVDACICALVVFDGRLFFTADDGEHGFELWSTDGTGAGTAIAVDVVPGPDHSLPLQTTPLGDRLIFVTVDENRYWRFMWTTDGTADGTQLLHEFNDVVGFASRTYPPMVWNGRLYFEARGREGSELWSTNGTPDGTSLVADVHPGSAGSSPWILGALGSHIVFCADDGTHGHEPWLTNGTRTGTRMLDDFSPGAVSSLFKGCLAEGGRMYCTATDGVYGREPVVIVDPETAHIVRDIYPGHIASDATWWLAWGSRLYLSANDGVHGNELWAVESRQSHTHRLHLPAVRRGGALTE